MLKKTDYLLEPAIVLFLFILINVLSQILQQPISFNDGHGWDGSSYFQIAEQFAAHSLPNTEAPFVNRIGTPFLAALFFKNDLLFGFKVVNIAGNLITTVLMLYWLRLYLHDRKTRLLLVALFLLMWHGPVRFVYYYPAFCDPWLFVALLTGLIGIAKIQQKYSLRHIAVLSFTVSAGAMFRETSLIITIALLFVNNPLILSRELFSAGMFGQLQRAIKSIPVTLFIPLFVGLCSFLLVLQIVTPSNSFSFIKTAYFMACNKPLLNYLHSWFITFGPMLIFPLYYWRGTFSFLSKNQFMLVYLLVFTVLAWIGGYDTERILFWAVPVVFMLIGKSLEDNSVWVKSGKLELSILLGLQLLAERAFWTLPDYPNDTPTPMPILTVPGNQFQYLDLFSYQGHTIIEAVSFAEYLLLSILIVLWLKFRVGNRIANLR